MNVLTSPVKYIEFQQSVSSGPIQLSYNYNYGLFSKMYLGDKMILLNDPDRVKKDGELAFVSALWFWMTPQVCSLPGSKISIFRPRA